MNKAEHAAKYPECTKWAAVVDDKRTIEEFLDWARSTHDMHLLKEGRDGDFFVSSLENLLREYFEIDSTKLEEERRAMIEELHKNSVSE